MDSLVEGGAPPNSDMDPVVQKLLWAFMRFRTAGHPKRTMAGLSPGEIRTLFCVKGRTRRGATETTVSDISRMLHVTSPSITQFLNALENRGLISREPDRSDRRAVAVRLTEAGERVTKRAAEMRQTELRGLVEYLGPDQSAQFADLLDKVGEYFRTKAYQDLESVWNEEELA